MAGIEDQLGASLPEEEGVEVAKREGGGREMPCMGACLYSTNLVFVLPFLYCSTNTLLVVEALHNFLCSFAVVS